MVKEVASGVLALLGCTRSSTLRPSKGFRPPCMRFFDHSLLLVLQIEIEELIGHRNKAVNSFMRRQGAASGQAGFTLLELLLAVTLGGIVLSAVYSNYGAAFDANRRIAQVATDTQAWRFFTERLRTDLKNLLVEKQALTGERETLTLQLVPQKNGSEEIRYEYHTTSDGGQIRRHVRRGEEEAEETDTVVFDGASRLAFRYLNDGNWQEESGEHLPRAVECSVEGAGRKRSLVMTLEVEDVEDVTGDNTVEDVKDSTIK